MDQDYKIVCYDEFAIRWYREHPDDKYLPPLFGGPMDEIFLKNSRRNNLYLPTIVFAKKRVPEPIEACPMDAFNLDGPSPSSSTEDFATNGSDYSSHTLGLTTSSLEFLLN